MIEDKHDCTDATCKSWFPVLFYFLTLILTPLSMGCLGGLAVIKPSASRMFRNVEEELSDSYVICHMLQLSGLFRSHPNQCVSLELAVQAACGGNESINHD